LNKLYYDEKKTKTSISYRFRNKGRKLLKFRKFDEKRAITPKWVLTQG
jgi:hypothetical protein